MLAPLCLALGAGITLVSAQESNTVGKFFNPPNTLGPTTDYSTNPVWTIGETQTIKFTTIYQNYTIELWQQDVGKPSATAGPIIFQAHNGAVTQFDWAVQLFSFNLLTSNIFFLWIKPLGEDPDALEVTSHYVNFTTEENTASKSSASSKATFSSSSTSSTASPPIIAPASSTSSKASPESGTAEGLSTGAKAGIGVGISLLVIAALGLGVCFFRRSRRKSKETVPHDGQVAYTDEGKEPSDDLPEPTSKHMVPTELYCGAPDGVQSKGLGIVGTARAELETASRPPAELPS
ncbi:hypothetical protein F4780DRAFT_766204 [Xylariomycetidae sp. FL0641]|nr:hypothetical protein F4780DRAFT_766204 [Xylariomycetidae sp. FL0641]